MSLKRHYREASVGHSETVESLENRVVSVCPLKTHQKGSQLIDSELDQLPITLGRTDRARCSLFFA